MMEQRREMAFNHGLRGHETVIRLVGKRRRIKLSATFPVRPAGDTGTLADADASPDGKHETSQSQSTCSDAIGCQRSSGETLLVEERISESVWHNGDRSVDQMPHIGWVQCPICAKSVREDVINTHLDSCLQGGAKGVPRKSKQLTMSRFSGAAFMSTIPGPSLPASRVTAVEQQRNFGLVKVEAVMPFGASEHNSLSCPDIRDQTNEEKRTFGLAKTEDLEQNEASSSVAGGPFGRDGQKSRLTLRHRRRAQAEDQNKVSPKKEGAELVSTTSSPRGSVSDTGMLKISRELRLSCEGQELLHMQELPKTMNSVVEDIVYQASQCMCSCHHSALDDQKLVSGSEITVRDMKRVVGEWGMDCDGSEENSANTCPQEISSGSSAVQKEKFSSSALVGVVDTKIVGRRYNRGSVCKEGMKVAVMREPDNPKDPNAIKVVPFEIGGPAFGHLAREISLHLFELLDKDLLHVWGTVTSLPEHPHGAVPIRLFLESKVPKGELFKFDGAVLSLQSISVAAQSPETPQRSSGSVSKYQENFLFMLQTVLERDSHLFTREEYAFLNMFRQLNDDAQRLFIRLYQRKGPWFRLSTIEYKDVADVCGASNELLAAAYMSTEDYPDEEFEVALQKRIDVLNVLELRQFLCTVLMKKKSEVAASKKDDLIKMAVSAGVQKFRHVAKSSGQSASTLKRLLTETTGKCVRVSDLADFLFWRLKRLFFLNGDTELSAFLVVDMGLVKYPRYKCWRAQNVFESRSALLAYEQVYCGLRAWGYNRTVLVRHLDRTSSEDSIPLLSAALGVAQGMDLALECNDTETALKLLEGARQQMILDDSNLAPAARTPTFLARFSASYVYRNVCTLGVSILEREHRYADAVDVLKQLLSTKTIKSGRWGYWTVRLSVDLDHLGRKEESLQTTEEGVRDPWIRGGDRVALQRRVVRLGKPPRRWKTPPYAAALKRNCKEVQIQGRPLSSVPGVRSWFYGYDGQQCRVEELALQYYASEEGGGWQGVHCEGGIWMTFFGLLMWDVLFAHVPDVFQTAFQTAPLDLDTEVFFSARQTLIEAQLTAIAVGDTAELLARAWNQNVGVLCRGVNWERQSLTEFQTIASCIGGPGLSAVCRLLAGDYAGWTAGMPDLLLWRPPTTADSVDPSEAATKSLCYRGASCSDCGCSESGKIASEIEGPVRGSKKSTLPVKGQKGQVGREGANVYGSGLPTSERCGNRGDAKLVEVKGPRDRLSEQQRAWIWLLMSAGLSVEVCKVLEKPPQ